MMFFSRHSTVRLSNVYARSDFFLTIQTHQETLALVDSTEVRLQIHLFHE